MAWSDTAAAFLVCRELARLHDSPGLPQEGFSWNYEAEVARSAQETLDLAATVRDGSRGRYWHRLGDLRRVVAVLPAIRSRLLSGATTVIHGDMHPGNVILRRGQAGVQVVLIDWARARVGSPLEDVASWLHALGCWEPQARRRHDTLMRAYLDARTVRHPFDANVRLDYWSHPSAMVSRERSATTSPRWQTRPRRSARAKTRAWPSRPGSVWCVGRLRSSVPIWIVVRDHSRRGATYPGDFGRGERVGAIDRPD